MKEYIPEYNDLECAYSRETLDRINKGVGDLFIEDYVKIKYMHLSYPIYDKTQYLPIELIRDYLKAEILKANKIIEENPEWSIFDRPSLFTITKDEEQVYSENKYTNFEHIINSFSYLDVYDYLNYSPKQPNISEKDLNEYSDIGSRFPIELPKINELIDYLAYLEYYKWLIDSFKNNKPEVPTSKKGISLKINLTKLQQKKLYDLLLYNAYIASDTDFESFKWAFSNQKKTLFAFQKIKWIDLSTTRKEYNARTLFELLFLLKIDKDTSANNPESLYRKIEYCFSEFDNLTTKNDSAVQGNTPRKKLLKEIVDKVLAEK